MKRATWSFPGYSHGYLPDGNYTGTIPAANISDVAGNAPVSSIVATFYFVDGDANHDRTVDLTDFTFLASNFNQSGRTFSQGDFDYSGTVDLTDFTILASKFNTTLSPAAGNVAAEAVTPLSGARGMSDLFSDEVVRDNRLIDLLV